MIPGGVNSPVRAFGGVGDHPVYFESASGSRFTDADGNEYVDFCQSWGPLILGHAHPAVIKAVKETSEKGLSFGACHRGEIELAERILRAFPNYDRVRLVNSGTEAVMTALRTARGATGRNLSLKFEGCYHGHFDGMLVKAGSGLATQSISTSRGIPDDVAKTTLVAPLDDEESVKEIFQKHGKDIADVIIEPLPANNGLLIQRGEFLAFLRDITEKNGSLLIFDEVISGFRMHYGGYGSHIGISPDMTTLGKIIGGGMPVGAVVGRATEMDRLAPLGDIYQAGTLSGNPVSLAAGCATLEVLESESPYKKIDELGRRFVSRLNASGKKNMRALQAGSIIWPYLDEGDFPRSAGTISSSAMQHFKDIYYGVLSQGFYMPPSSYEVMFISAAHSGEDVDGLADAILNASTNVRT